MTTWQITRGTPSAEETAALTAVLTAVLTQRATAVQASATETKTGEAGWHRPHRNPHPSAGMWRGR
ncbi:acyl-CoA carboxylase subunit epsilon [Streptomyces sp. ISL-96]|uniref:acyl-CoA carboxylase subunit epsilon n=1 Tax=Streptomyces sp. ISL-96 TaxID=2819191 RepID=UPI001BEBC4E6|nr:acyl-CoA carboxylase subunit epsilon [Streptomyces sp. ISL-96]MBT2493455.1 acyl-CoA carboxylase subunit epsilon [Streptomyces sp. ISL-96]